MENLVSLQWTTKYDAAGPIHFFGGETALLRLKSNSRGGPKAAFHFGENSLEPVPKANRPSLRLHLVCDALVHLGQVGEKLKFFRWIADDSSKV
jgi:hypothetical protein